MYRHSFHLKALGHEKVRNCHKVETHNHFGGGPFANVIVQYWKKYRIWRKLSLYAQTANKYPLVSAPPKNSPRRSSSNWLVDFQHTLVSILQAMG